MSNEMVKTVPQPPSLAQYAKTQLQSIRYIKEGDVLESELISKTPRAAFFDLGRFGTGIVYGAELINARDLVKKMADGDRIAAKVINLENKEGYIELSLSEAGRQQLWQKIKDLQEEGAVIKVKINGANAGGLLADLLDLKAFLPVSQLSNDHYPKVEEGDKQKIAEELKKFIGEELSVKIIDVNPRYNKLIVSERETLAGNTKEVIAQYKTGQVVQALITGLANFGVFVRFVDNPQVEGLIHVSELTHQLAVNPKDVAKINEVVQAKIIDIKDDRIFLSLKVLEANPWEKIGELYSVGQEIQGAVHSFNPYGAIINLDSQIQGVVHVSEFGSTEEMKKALTSGSSPFFTIESIKPEEKRITLKLKDKTAS